MRRIIVGFRLQDCKTVPVESDGWVRKQSSKFGNSWEGSGWKWRNKQNIVCPKSAAFRSHPEAISNCRWVSATISFSPWSRDLLWVFTWSLPPIFHLSADPVRNKLNRYKSPIKHSSVQLRRQHYSVSGSIVSIPVLIIIPHYKVVKLIPNLFLFNSKVFSPSAYNTKCPKTFFAFLKLFSEGKLLEEGELTKYSYLTKNKTMEEEILARKAKCKP